MYFLPVDFKNILNPTANVVFKLLLSWLRVLIIVATQVGPSCAERRCLSCDVFPFDRPARRMTLFGLRRSCDAAFSQMPGSDVIAIPDWALHIDAEGEALAECNEPEYAQGLRRYVRAVADARFDLAAQRVLRRCFLPRHVPSRLHSAITPVRIRQI